MTIPLESQKIADALNKIFSQMDLPKNLNDLVNNAVQLTKAVTEKQEGLYKNSVVPFVNKHPAETTQTVKSGIESAEKNQAGIYEALADSAKQFERNAPADTSNRYKEQITPKSPSR